MDMDEFVKAKKKKNIHTHTHTHTEEASTLVAATTTAAGEKATLSK